MGEKLPISFVEKQMNREYYFHKKTLKWIFAKYKNYTEEEIKKALGVYYLDEVQEQDWTFQWFKPELQREWDRTCQWVHELLERRKNASDHR